MAKTKKISHPDNLKVGTNYRFSVMTSGGTITEEDGIYERMEVMPGPGGKSMLMLWFTIDMGEDGYTEVPFEWTAIRTVREVL